MKNSSHRGAEALRTGASQQDASDWHRVLCVMVVVDMVESVRLMSEDEEGTVLRWQAFVHEVQTRILPSFAGRLANKWGDGLVLEFSACLHAVAAVNTLHRSLAEQQLALPLSRRIWLRAGLHWCSVLRLANEVYGVGVNTAARLAALAAPGETLCSEAARDQLIDGLDARIEDLGDCWVKHLSQPLRVFRLSPPHLQELRAKEAMPAPPPAPLVGVPTLAVIPLRSANLEPQAAALGEWVAQAVMDALLPCPDVRLISRMSTRLFQNRDWTSLQLQEVLHADYVLSGSVQWRGATIEMTWMFRATRSEQVIWQQRITGKGSDVRRAAVRWREALVARVLQSLQQDAWQQGQARPLPALNSSLLLMVAVQAMHGSSGASFGQARAQLEALIERHPRLAAPRSWLALWHVLSVTRGVVEASPDWAQQALRQVRQALDLEPHNDQAWATQGFVQCHLLGDLDRATESIQRALSLAPSQPWAWLFKTTIDSLCGRTSDAFHAAQQALALSPIDPLKYYHCCLAGHAAAFDHRNHQALAWLIQSWRLNRVHAPTVRMLVVVHQTLGHTQEAKQFLRELLVLEPGLTVEKYLARIPVGHPERRRFAARMAEAGLPQR
jgi:adenylate cyclase